MVKPVVPLPLPRARLPVDDEIESGRGVDSRAGPATVGMRTIEGGSADTGFAADQLVLSMLGYSTRPFICTHIGVPAFRSSGVDEQFDVALFRASAQDIRTGRFEARLTAEAMSFAVVSNAAPSTTHLVSLNRRVRVDPRAVWFVGYLPKDANIVLAGSGAAGAHGGKLVWTAAGQSDMPETVSYGGGAGVALSRATQAPVMHALSDLGRKLFT